MKKWLILLALIVVLAATLGCRAKKLGSIAASGRAPIEPNLGLDIAYEESPAAAISLSTSEAKALPSTRMVIKTASLSIRVNDVNKAYTKATQLVEEKGGYVQSATLSEAEQASAELRIKVSPSNFLSLIAALEGLGRVERKGISGQDVTEEYMDLAAELETQLEVRSRLFDLLRKARNVEEAIGVEEQLERVGYNVNRIKGRIKYLETMVGESSINLTLYSESLLKPEPFLNWSKIGQGFVIAARILLQILMGILYALIVLIPLAVIGGGIAWGVIRILRERKAKKKPK